MILLRKLRDCFRPKILQIRLQSSNAFEEVRIPVPFGYIAGKWWGPKDKRPILAIHGWQDNCGTFDPLISILPKDISFLAIDLPGHGYSSHLPPGIFYFSPRGIILIRQIQEYFKWEKVSLMSHSMGGFCAYAYAFLHPENIDFLILIDGFHNHIHTDPINSARRSIDTFMKAEKLNERKTESFAYTLDQMQEKLHVSSQKSVDLDKTKYLLARNCKESQKYPGKFCFTRDQRLKTGTIVNWSNENYLKAAERVTFPTFISRTESILFRDKDFFANIVNIYKKRNNNVEVHDMPGTHHVHLNNPELFKEIITGFIRKYDVEDRARGGMMEEIRLSNFIKKNGVMRF